MIEAPSSFYFEREEASARAFEGVTNGGQIFRGSRWVRSGKCPSNRHWRVSKCG